MAHGFRSLHPFPAFLYFAGSMLLTMLFFHPIFLAGGLTVMGLLNVLYGSREQLLRTFVANLSVGLLAMILNPVFSHRGEHIWFYAFDQPVTLESIWYGVTMSLSLVAILFIFRLYQHFITSDRFLYLFSALWPKGALVIVIALRFVPLFRQRLDIIMQVQRTKGIGLSRGSLAQRAGNGMKLLQILLTWSLEEALQTADSMKARGFGLGRRSAYSNYRMRPRDWRFAIFIAAATGYGVAVRLMGQGQLAIYPHLEPVSLAAAEWWSWGAFMLLLAAPLLADGGEWLKWRSSNSGTSGFATRSNANTRYRT